MVLELSCKLPLFCMLVVYGLTIVYSLTINLKEITLWDTLHTAKTVKNKNRSHLKCFIRKRSHHSGLERSTAYKEMLILKIKKKRCKKIIYDRNHGLCVINIVELYPFIF